jgi:putative flavoprotein involved in K+ transport
LQQSHDVVVVGAGQSGLSISHELTRAGREHIILERGATAQSWRDRWDSFSLVLPNWTIRLAGAPYQGPDPQGFLKRAEVVDYLGSYASSFDAPVQGGVEVRRLQPRDQGFVLDTSAGVLGAREVVIATGGMQQPYRPAAISEVPPGLPVLGSAEYRNPAALPPGDILVIGSGQSGCQIAEELHLAGRRVYLSCGKVGWTPRRIGGQDVIAWLVNTPLFNQTAADLPSPMARLAGNPQTTGRNGGYDLNFRTLQAQGVVLTGHLLGVEEGRAYFASDLADSVAFGDARYADMCQLVVKVAIEQGVPVPSLPEPPPFTADAPAAIELATVAAVIVCAGYRPGYASWVLVPNAFDEMGFPLQVDGTSTVHPRLHFMGGQFQRTRSSASLYGVGEDAAVLASKLLEKSAMA